MSAHDRVDSRRTRNHRNCLRPGLRRCPSASALVTVFLLLTTAPVQLASAETPLVSNLEATQTVIIEAKHNESGSVYEDSYCYFGSMEISNDNVAGHGEAAGWVRFDTSIIPDGSDITGLTLYFYPYLWDEIGGPHVDFNGFTSDPVGQSCSQRFQDATAGPAFFANGWVIGIGWTPVDLGSAGQADLENRLGEDWFAVGFDHLYQDNHWFVAEGFSDSHEPYIEVTYQDAPLPPDPDLQSVTAPAEVPLGLPFRVEIQAENDGATSLEGAINASARYADGSHNLTITNVAAPWADLPIFQLSPAEGPIYDDSCAMIPGGAVDHLVESVDTDWDQNESYTLQFDVTPAETGDLWLRVRTTMKGAGACEYYNDHSIGGGVTDTDQQGWEVERLTVYVNTPPTISMNAPDPSIAVVGDEIELSWIDVDPDNNAAVTLAYDVDADPENNTGHAFLVAGLLEDPDQAADQYLWDTSGIEPGTYWVWAMIYDGLNPEVYDLAPTQVTLAANEPPIIDLLQPDVDLEVVQGDPVVIVWTDNDPDDQALITLAYDSDSDPQNGTGDVELVSGLDENPDGASDSYGWDTTGVPPGTYWVWARIDDGVNPPVHDLSPGRVTVTEVGESDIRVEPSSLSFSRQAGGSGIQRPRELRIDKSVRERNHAHVRRLLEKNSVVRVMVHLDSEGLPSASPEARRQEVAQRQERVLSGLTERELALVHRFPLTADLAGRVSNEGLERLLEHPEVKMVYEDPIGTIALDESVPLIRADEVASQLGVTGNGVVVAVIDSGIDIDHPDLVDDLIAQQCFTDGACPPGNSDTSEHADDDDGHGTNVSGIMSSAGIVAPLGVAPDVDLVAVKAIDNLGNGFLSDWVAGIQWITDNVETLGVSVINMSLGTTARHPGDCDTEYPTLAAAVQTATDAGITIFAGSGNDASTTEMRAPACASGVIAVGAVYDAPFSIVLASSCTDVSVAADQIACFSNRNESLDVLGPSYRNRTTGLDGGIETDFGGTSAASPHAAAVAALMLEINPELTPAQIRQILVETGVPITDDEPPDGTGLVFPRIDAWAAVSSSGLRIWNDGDGPLVVSAIDVLGDSCWLETASPEGLPFTIESGDSQSVFVAADEACVEVGLYSDTIRITSNDPDEDPVDVPVSLEVTDPPRPDLVVSVPAVSATPPFAVGQSVEWTVTTTNQGTAPSPVTRTAYYLGASCDDLSDPIDDDLIQILAPDESVGDSDSYTFQVDDVGMRYLIARADDRDDAPSEILESNNTSCYGPFEVVHSCFELSLSYTGEGLPLVATPSSEGCATGTYAEGETVTLEATPAAGWAVASWTGTSNDASTATTNSLVMPGMAHIASVTYAPICYPLTTTHSGEGNDPAATPSSEGCATGTYAEGETVTLEANPAAGWAVASWTGTANDASTATTNSLVMPGMAHTASVTYAPICFLLTTTHSGQGSDPVATPSSEGCATGTYAEGETVTLEANPAAGWQVASWAGTSNDASTATTNSLVMPGMAHIASVTYAPICYPLTTTHSGQGNDPVATPSSEGCATGTYAEGETVTLEANPAAGWQVASWAGTSNDASTATTNSLVMPDMAHTAAVTYAPICYPLTTAHSGEGSDPVATPSSEGCATGNYAEGETVTLEANPETGWRVASWMGTSDDSSTSTINSLLMPGNTHEASVRYGLIDEQLLVNGGCEDSGIAGDPLNPWVCHGGCDLGLVSTPVIQGAGACFASNLTASWQGPAQLIDPALFVDGATYDASAFVLATQEGFSAQVMLFLQDSTGGSRFIPIGDFQPVSSNEYSPIGGSATVAFDGTLQLARFYVQGTVAEPFYVDDLRLTSATDLAFHDLLVSLDGPGQGSVLSLPAGISCGSDCLGSFVAGTAVVLVPTALPGSMFAGWSGACIGTGSCVVSMDSNQTVVAAFAVDESGSNVLANPSCESVPAPWVCHIGCSIETVEDPVQAGTTSCRVFDLTQGWQGPSQTIAPGAFTAGSTYCASAWVRGTEPFQGELILYMADEQGVDFTSMSGEVDVGTGSFSLLEGTATLDWVGQLQEVRLYAQGTTAPFFLDNAFLGTCQNASADQYFVQSGEVLDIPFPGVLANDGDPLLLTASVVRTSANGSLTLFEDGSFVYEPAPGFQGIDSFTYQASDGANSSSATPVILWVGFVFADGFETGDVSRWSGSSP